MSFGFGDNIFQNSSLKKDVAVFSETLVPIYEIIQFHTDQPRGLVVRTSDY
jgi:hypothetical protein